MYKILHIPSALYVREATFILNDYDAISEMDQFGLGIAKFPTKESALKYLSKQNYMTIYENILYCSHKDMWDNNHAALKHEFEIVEVED